MDKVIIADFGMAREITASKKKHNRRMSLLHYTTCPPYCAPEGILQCETYGTGVDIWAFGCIWLEMILGRPYFKKISKFDNILEKIFPICNATYLNSKETVQYITSNEKLQETAFLAFNNNSHPNLSSLLKNTDVTPEEICILEKIFQLDPMERLSAKELLENSFFTC